MILTLVLELNSNSVLHIPHIIPTNQVFICAKIMDRKYICHCYCFSSIDIDAETSSSFYEESDSSCPPHSPGYATVVDPSHPHNNLTQALALEELPALPKLWSWLKEALLKSPCFMSQPPAKVETST